MLENNINDSTGSGVYSIKKHIEMKLNIVSYLVTFQLKRNYYYVKW